MRQQERGRKTTSAYIDALWDNYIKIDQIKLAKTTLQRLALVAYTPVVYSQRYE